MAITVKYSLTDASDPESAGVITGRREKVVEAADITHLSRQTLNLSTAVKFIKRQQAFLFLQDRPFVPLPEMLQPFPHNNDGRVVVQLVVYEDIKRPLQVEMVVRRQQLFLQANQ